MAGLLIGADDYIVKPFDPDELLVRALLRRHDGHHNRHEEPRENGDSPPATLTSSQLKSFGDCRFRFYYGVFPPPLLRGISCVGRTGAAGDPRRDGAAILL